jgi:hypothetical protein
MIDEINSVASAECRTRSEDLIFLSNRERERNNQKANSNTDAIGTLFTVPSRGHMVEKVKGSRELPVVPNEDAIGTEFKLMRVRTQNRAGKHLRFWVMGFRVFGQNPKVFSS